MGGRHSERGANGRFVRLGEGPGTELKRARGAKAGGRPQRRKRHKKAVTETQRQTFLSTLATTCNVSAAARASGRQTQNFYLLRRRDAGFRAAWMEALREGYDHLELEMVQRARFGVEKDVFHQGVRTAKTRVFDDANALRLLHLHRGTVTAMRVDEEEAPRHPDEIFSEVVARLEEVRARGVPGGAAAEEPSDAA